MTQQTMTKEQIIDNVLRRQKIVKYIFYFKAAMRDSMELYAQQEVAKERERSEKMVDYIMKLQYAMEIDGLKDYAENLKQSLSEYRNKPETTGNQTAC